MRLQAKDNEMKPRYVAAFVLIVAIFRPSLGYGESAAELLAACKPITHAKMSRDHIALDTTSQTGQCWGAFSVLQEESRWIDSPHLRVLGACVPEHARR